MARLGGDLDDGLTKRIGNRGLQCFSCLIADLERTVVVALEPFLQSHGLDWTGEHSRLWRECLFATDILHSREILEDMMVATLTSCFVESVERKRLASPSNPGGPDRLQSRRIARSVARPDWSTTNSRLQWCSVSALGGLGDIRPRLRANLFLWGVAGARVVLTSATAAAADFDDRGLSQVAVDPPAEMMERRTLRSMVEALADEVVQKAEGKDIVDLLGKGAEVEDALFFLAVLKRILGLSDLQTLKLVCFGNPIAVTAACRSRGLGAKQVRAVVGLLSCFSDGQGSGQDDLPDVPGICAATPSLLRDGEGQSTAKRKTARDVN